MIESIRNLPRPIGFGLLSAFIVAIPYPIIESLGWQMFWMGSIAPLFIPFPELMSPSLNFEPVHIHMVYIAVQTLLLAIVWFAIGWAIGRNTSETYIAVLVWLGVQLLGYILGFIRFVFWFGPT